MKKVVLMAAMIALPLGLAGCDKKAETPKAKTTTDAMEGMAMAPETKMAKGSGTVTAIDAAAGKITLDHGPIAELEWPAMKMGFSAKPELLKGIAVGDSIAFDLEVAGSSSEITAIKKQ